MRLLHLCLLGTFAASLSGCAIYDTVSGAKKQEYKKNAQRLLDEAHQHIPKERKYSNITFDDNYFVPPRTTKENYPDWYDQPVELAIIQPIPMNKIMGIFQAQAGVISRAVNEAGDKGINMEVPIPLTFTGRMGDAVKKISLATGYGYEIEDNLLTWSKYVTKTIFLSVPPTIQSFRIGDKDDADGASSAGGLGAGGFGATTVQRQDTSDSYSKLEVKDLETWAEIKKALLILKSKEGEVSFDRTTSLLLVKDYPRNIKSIENYIDVATETAMTQVVFEFQFLEYRDNSGAMAQLNLNLANADIGLRTVDATANLVSNLTQSVLADANPVSLGFNITSGKWANSSVLIDALAQQGVVSVLSRPTLLAAHNKSASIDLGNERSYASSAGSNQNQTSTSSGIQSTILEFGTKINVLPTIMGDSDELFVQLGIDLSDLADIEVFESGGSRVQNPLKSKQKMILSFAAHSGETILITGNKSNRNEYKSEDSGILSFLFGGSRSSSEEYSELLILITPRIIRHRRS